MTDVLTPGLNSVLSPTPGFLADILHVELATGARSGTTYGTDTYGQWDYGGKQDWQRWDCDITTLNLFRGRQTMLERNSPGVCTFTAVQIVPASWMTTPPTARPARIVTSKGQVVFYGVIETADLNREYGVAEWSVVIVDDLARLGRLEVGTLVRPVEQVWQRVDALLTAAGMLPQLDPFKTYDVRVQAVNGTGRKVLDEMGIAVDTWRWTVIGDSFPQLGATPLVDRTGWFTTRLAQQMPQLPGTDFVVRDDYLYPWRISPTPAAHPYNTYTWLGDALHAEFSADLADLRNYLTYASAGGTANVYQDAGSVDTYGPRSYQRMDLIAAPGVSAPWNDPAYANLLWSQVTMEPNPKMRLKTITVDCWNRPTGSAPLVDILGNLDVTQLCEVALPDQDDAGGDIGLDPIPPRSFGDTPTCAWIYGMSWELSDREALLTLSIDRPIKRTT